MEGKRQEIGWWTNQNFVKTKISKGFQKKRWLQCGEGEWYTVVFVGWEMGLGKTGGRDVGVVWRGWYGLEG